MAENKNFEQMSEEEKDKLAHEIVLAQFLFAKTVASAFGSGTPEKNEIVKFIMKEFINELAKYVEKKSNL